MKKQFFLLPIILIFTSCGPGTLSLKEFPHNTDYEVIDLNEAFKSDEYWNENEVFKSEEPMIFEENKDNPLDKYEFCGIANDNIYLLSQYYNGYILVYNMQGKFIKRLTDPDTGELINNIDDLYVDNFNNTLLILSSKSSHLYEVRSLDGKLIKTYYYNGHGLLKNAQCGYVNCQSSNYTNHKYTTRNDYHYYFTSYDKNFKEIGTYYSNLASGRIELRPYKSSNDENTYFGVCYDNHVYSLDSTGIIKAKYYVEFSDYEIHLDEGEFPGKYCFSGQFFEFGNWQFFNFRKSYRDNDDKLIVRNKKTGVAKKFKYSLWVSKVICYKNSFYEHKKYTLQD